ncbi:hypothetical protein BH11ACT3_BH11ACT3_24820 [soil metagenome]
MLITDRIVGLGIALATGYTALLLLAQISQFSQLAANGNACDGAVADGLRCSPDFLNVMIIVGYALIIFGWGLTTAFMIVRFIRLRLGWFLPLIGFGVMVAGFYVVILVIYASYLPAL